MLRGANQKIAVNGSDLAQPLINNLSKYLIEALNEAGAEGRQLKSIIIGCSRSGAITSALLVEDENFQREELTSKLKALITGEKWGIDISLSNLKSPA